MIRAGRWRPADGIQLEPNALLAARETQRSLAITAGPGAGKTELLAQRADFLLRTGACRYPQRILAISFKVDAARNLKERVRRRCGPVLATRLDSHTFHAFAKRLIDRFRPVLTGRDALDADYTIGRPRMQHRQIEFEDMVPLAVQILQSSDVARHAVQQTYSHVFLDEFQDCTDAQYELIRAAFRGTNAVLTAVGDTKQRIMGWAGALEGVFKTFAAEFRARPLNLYQNFRSLPRLRRMHNAMVRVMDPAAAVSDAELTGAGGEIEIAHFADDDTEAHQLASTIRRWMDEGVPASQIAVLVSRQPELYAVRLEAELAQQGIPFRNEQALQDLSAEPATCLIVDFLRVTATDGNPEAYARLTEVLEVTGGDDERDRAQQMRWRRFVDDTRQELRDLPGPPAAADLERVTTCFLDRLGRDALVALSADYQQGARLDEVIAQTGARLVEMLDLHPDLAQVLGRFAEDNAVRIMTIHKSKGLEFDSVVLLGVEAQTFWGNQDDERAAFFVGVSRAKRRLLLTAARRRRRPAGFMRRWDEVRQPHIEFLGYAATL
ncbi:UvrD-helicase domain-containing protein [Xenophilus azovorans]|uniref:UvrD-helicase domain-containing protein n=1 Tax=Xenophilus azovorans TaxID=151755 RepID=UPI00057084FF|nr:ATP-dependent helicase [Xenophilus azovorans]